MSQKPRAGAQTRPTSVTRATSRQAMPNTDSGKVDGAMPAETAQPEVPLEMTEPEIAAPEKLVTEPVVTAEEIAEVPTEVPTGVPVGEPVESIAMAVEPPVEPTHEATTPLVAEVVAEVAGQAAAIKPTNPTPTPKLTQGIKTMMKSAEDIVAFSQANLEAFVKSGQIWSAGVQELTKQMASSAKASFDESISTFKAISTAKSVKEAIDLQSSFAKAALEKAMAESNKLTDASIKLTEETLAPITARVTVAVETFKTH